MKGVEGRNILNIVYRIDFLGKILSIILLVLFFLVVSATTEIQVMGTYHGGFFVLICNSIVFILAMISCIIFFNLFKPITQSDFNKNVIFAIAVILVPLLVISYSILYYTYKVLTGNYMITVHQGMGYFESESVHEIIIPVILGWILYFNLFILFWNTNKKYKLIPLIEIFRESTPLPPFKLDLLPRSGWSKEKRK